ncbi:MAG: helix-turn-helix transcriptional regulator [Gammaproteobacteria bacterium]
MHNREAVRPDVTCDPEAAPSVVLFESELVRVGRFRCSTGHPRFADSGPTQNFCFVFPRTAVWIEHEGSRPFVADPNVIPLYNRAHPYRRRAISPQGDRTDWFGVSPELLREGLGRYDPHAADSPDKPFRVGYVPSTPPIYAWQRAVFDCVSDAGYPDALFVEESVVGILAQVLMRLNGDRVPLHRERRHREIVEDARAHLSATYTRNENLSSVASAVDVSVFHLCRIFRRLTDTTLHRYRNQMRLHSALEWLGDAGKDILSVATELGYSGHSHFTAAFRDAFGWSPSEWRSTSSQSRAAAAGEVSRALRR